MDSIGIYSLPFEIIFEIVFHLSVRELFSLSLTCRHLFRFWKEEKIWQNLLRFDFPEITLHSENSLLTYKNFVEISKVTHNIPIFFVHIQDQFDEVVTKTLSNSPESILGICLACWSNYSEDIFGFFQQKGNERLSSLFFCSDLDNPKILLDNSKLSLYFSLTSPVPFTSLDLKILFHRLQIFMSNGWRKSNIFILSNRSLLKVESLLPPDTQQFRDHIHDAQIIQETGQIYRKISDDGFLLSVRSQESKTIWWFHL